MILQELFLLVAILLLAGKDATSYLLKDKNSPYNQLEKTRIQRWHRDGTALWLLFTGSITYNSFLLHQTWYLIPIYSTLLRLTIYDLAFNKWASLSYTYLGSTAWADKVFVKLFGSQGAVKKAITFGLITLALNLLKSSIFAS
jgi:hypothetical protein